MEVEVVVRGKNVKLDPAMHEIAQLKLAKVSRIANDVQHIEVDFSEVRNAREPLNQLCEVTVHLKRHFVKAHAAAGDATAALDLVVDKVEHQVSRLKDKRVSRSHARRRVSAQLPALEDWEADADQPNGDDAARAEIVRTKRFVAKPMDAGEAALEMDLLGHAFFLFVNVETGNACVLYRRRDGHLGLIEAIR